MRILIDECLPRELADELVGHEVRTVQQAGWAGLSNGELLEKVSGSFEVFLTIDKRIESEQKVPGDVALITIEGTVPAGYPEPGLFQQSLGWLDENGVGLRYQSYYSNGYPPPPRVNRAGRGQGQGRIDAPDANAGQRR